MGKHIQIILYSFTFLNICSYSFSEAVSSPHPQVPQQLAARFTFNDQAGTSGTRSAIVPTAGSSIEAMDDTRIDLSQLDPATVTAAIVMASPAAVVPSQQVSPSQRVSISEPTEVVVDLSTAEAAAVPIAIQAPEPVAGPSGSVVPEIVICNPAEFGELIISFIGIDNNIFVGYFCRND